MSSETGQTLTAKWNAVAIRGYAFAFGASLAYAASQIVARQSVSDFSAPLLGTTIALAFGTLGFTLIAWRSLGTPPADLRRGALFFAGAGLFSATGVASMFFAVERAEVVIVSPISSTHLLFTLLFAAMLLRDVERVTPRLLAGATLVVLGVVLISLA